MADRDRVTFTRGAAERIADAVRKVEIGERGGGHLRLEPQSVVGRQKTVRICTFTGSWSIGSAKTVTFKNQTTTPNTVSATNLFWPIPEGPQRDCSIAKDGSQWYLLVPQLEAGTALSTATLGSSLEFGRINVVSLGTASTVAISTTTCTT